MEELLLEIIHAESHPQPRWETRRVIDCPEEWVYTPSNMSRRTGPVDDIGLLGAFLARDFEEVKAQAVSCIRRHMARFLLHVPLDVFREAMLHAPAQHNINVGITVCRLDFTGSEHPAVEAHVMEFSNSLAPDLRLIQQRRMGVYRAAYQKAVEEWAKKSKTNRTAAKLIEIVGEDTFGFASMRSFKTL